MDRSAWSRLELRQTEVIHASEEPLTSPPLASRVDLDDAADHVGRNRDIGGDALCGHLGGIAVHCDRGFPFWRQGNPVMVEVRAVGEKAQHSVFAHVRGAIIKRKYGVVSKQARHR